MTVGEALKRFRERFKLTQKDIAITLNLFPQAYYRYESGRSTPQVDMIITLAKTYDVTTDYLLGLSNEPRPPKLDEKTLNLVRAMQAWQAQPTAGTSQ